MLGSSAVMDRSHPYLLLSFDKVSIQKGKNLLPSGMKNVL